MNRNAVGQYPRDVDVVDGGVYKNVGWGTGSAQRRGCHLRHANSSRTATGKRRVPVARASDAIRREVENGGIAGVEGEGDV